MMHRKFILFTVSVLLCYLFQCCDNGDTIIPASDMEDILYDYHLADGIASESKGGFEKNVLEYRAAVLRKYGVSQEKFDTSMVYYMRHTDELYAIYQRISDRMQEDARSLGANTSASVTSAGDSANVWNGMKTLVLMPQQPYNLYTFKLKTDSTFHKGDKLLLNFKSNFIFQDGMRDGIAMLAVVLGNDSVVSRVSHMSSNMKTTLQLDDNDSLGIKEIRGFFTLSKSNDNNSSSTTLQLMNIESIQLLRVHTKKTKDPVTPTVTGESTPKRERIPVSEATVDSERVKPIARE